MKKRLFFFLSKLFLLLFFGFLYTLSAYGQNVAIKGQVRDQGTGEPVIGASVVVKGMTLGTATDADGNFIINAPVGSALVVSYLGYANHEVTVDPSQVMIILLKEDAQLLEEVVVIGYGMVKKTDLTGSITAVSNKDFQKGAISSPDRLLVGKVAGVQITPNGGMPGSGSRIRIRGGASLNASNDPLIVLDGIPLDNSNVSGSPSLLSTINPDDIETMTVLKDASATAIYGSRASNGVIIITTKKGNAGQKLKINFSTQGSVATTANRLDLLTGDQVRTIVKTHPKSDDGKIALLGDANTDWQDEIYQNALGTDNNLSVSGSVKSLPYRISVGYLNQDGVLKTGNMERFTGSINLNPEFLDKHLKIDLSLKGTTMRNQYANQDAIGAAAAFDPTHPVYADGFDKFGGYFTWMSGDVPNQQSTYNPVMLLNTKDDHGTVDRGIVNFQVDYKMHFLPELRANLNLGYDYSHGKGSVYIPAWAPQSYARGGVNNPYDQEKTNKLLEFYLNYNKKFDSIKSLLDVTAGYTYQDWLTHTTNFDDHKADGSVFVPATFPYDEPRNTLISYFGRLNYTLMDKYLLTATVRRDGSSRFAPDVRWGTFPSFALAWRINEESFLKDVEVLSNLKLRLGYGETGQQDILMNYPYMPVYAQSTNTAQYQIGDKYYYMYRPNAYDEKIKWETTATTNVGIDYGFLNGRINGSIDVYLKKTKDLLSTIPVAAGSNFSNELLTNIGNMENKGIEFTFNAIPVQSKNWNWDFAFNVTYNKNEITKLTQVVDPNYKGVPVGTVSGGTGTRIQIHSVGYPAFTFYPFKQVYDTSGNPVEGLYADLSEDGNINDDDLYHYKSSEPDVTMGFSTNVSYKKWTLSTVLRASIGNYVFNNVNSNLGAYRLIFNPLGYIQNSPTNVLKSNFYESQYRSDFYMENGSFLKMDNLSLTYDFGRVFHNTVSIRANAGVQNVFTATKYSGLDPEVAGGIDNNLYPRPRTYTLGFNLTF